jgi:hypothetical protein
MKYGIFGLESGSALAWYESADAAFDAVRQIAESEPEAIDGLGLLEFDDNGAPRNSLQGQDLLNQAGGVVAA